MSERLNVFEPIWVNIPCRNEMTADLGPVEPSPVSAVSLCMHCESELETFVAVIESPAWDRDGNLTRRKTLGRVVACSGCEFGEVLS